MVKQVKNKIITFFWGWALFLAAACPAKADPLEFGVFPYLPPSKLVSLFTPIAESFEKTLDRPLHISTKGEYDAFSQELENEHYDIAFVQPFDYVMAHDKHNYQPLARRGEQLKAIIVVEQDSPIQSVEDLAGKTIANPPEVAAVSQLTSMTLKKAGLDPQSSVQRAYGKSHFSCMQRVIIGSADACGTARQALKHFEKKNMNKKFRIIAESEGIAHSLFIVHERVPAETRDKLLNAILDWPNTPEGQALLANGQFIPFVAASDADYEPVRQYLNAASGH